MAILMPSTLNRDSPQISSSGLIVAYARGVRHEGERAQEDSLRPEAHACPDRHRLVVQGSPHRQRRAL